MTKPTLSFVTGADDKYFFICNILLQSLEQFFPEIPCFVLDFGLTDTQTRFFESKKRLLKLPPHLKKTDHAYKLKSSLRSFLRDQPSIMPIWINSDIIAVAAESQQLIEIAHRLIDQRKMIAIAPDHGGGPEPVTIRQLYKSEERIPRFKSTVAHSPEILDQMYFNSGLVFFPDVKVLDNWEVVANSLEGDWLWEQNALNLICSRNPNEVMRLDPRVWNVHGSLLRKISVCDDGVYCDEKKSIFAHATAFHEPGRDIATVNLSVSKNGYGCNTYMRVFQNSFLRMAQDRHLSNFLSENFSLLKELNILFDLNTRRNDLCPCGSGKRFKHCHGVHL